MFLGLFVHAILASAAKVAIRSVAMPSRCRPACLCIGGAPGTGKNIEHMGYYWIGNSKQPAEEHLEVC